MAAPAGGAGAKRIRDDDDDGDDAQQPHAAAVGHGFGASAAAASAYRYDRPVQPPNSMARILDLNSLSIVIQHLDNTSMMRVVNSSSQLRRAALQSSSHMGRELHMQPDQNGQMHGIPSRNALIANPIVNRVRTIRGTFLGTKSYEPSTQRAAREFMKEMDRFTHMSIESIETLVMYARSNTAREFSFWDIETSLSIFPDGGLPLLKEVEFQNVASPLSFIRALCIKAPNLEAVRIGSRFRSRSGFPVSVHAIAPNMMNVHSTHFAGLRAKNLISDVGSLATAPRSCTVLEWASRYPSLILPTDVDSLAEKIKSTPLRTLKLHNVVMTQATLDASRQQLPSCVIEIHSDFILSPEQHTAIMEDTNAVARSLALLTTDPVIYRQQEEERQAAREAYAARDAREAAEQAAREERDAQAPPGMYRY